MAFDNSYLAPVTYGLHVASDLLGDSLQKSAFSNVNKGGTLKKFTTGRRQLRTLSQFKRFNAAGAVLGVGSSTFVGGASAYCSVQAVLSCSP